MRDALGKSVRLAIVEDHAPTRATLQHAFITRYADRLDLAAIFPNGDDALRGLTSSPVDVALVDLGLPTIGGADVIRALATKCPKTRCIAFSVYEDEPSVLEAICAGAHGYLVKDEPVERIVRAIEEAAGGEHPVSSRVAGFLLMRARSPAPSLLTDRELELAELLAGGLTYAECASHMSVGVGTVQDVVKRLYRKLEVNSRNQVREWVSQRLNRPT